MAWETALSATQLTSLTTEAVFQRSAADWKIDLNPGESAHVMLKANMGATDDVKFTIYGSCLDSPGAVPDAGQTLAGSDWHIVTEITADNSYDDDEWLGFSISGYRYIAATAQRVGTTDSGITADMYVSLSAVNAS